MGCTSGKRELRVMSYNIHAGIGMDDSLDLQRTAAVIKKVAPDFVGLQEVDSVTERTGHCDQVAELGRMTGMYPIFASAIECYGGKYGVAALVKEKPLTVRNIQLPGEEEQRTLLVLEYPDYLLCNTHFSLTSSSRKESIAKLESVLKEYDKPALITGDFNMEPDTEEFALMGNRWTLLSDPARFTFPSERSRTTIDYIWGYKDFEYLASGYTVLEEPMASDHCPIYLDVVF